MMSKMNELSQILDELTECGATLTKLAASIKEMFSAEYDTPEKPADPEPAKKPPTYTYVEVRKVCSAKSNAGFTDRVKALIERYGNGKLSGVKEEDYNALMAELEEIK